MYNILLACDGEYYNKWAINCIKSIKFYVPWVVISTYIVNPINVIEIPEVRYFYEDKNFESEASKIAYYQAVRFLKCAEIFPNNELVMSIDCDTLCTRSFSEADFKSITSSIHVQRHQKNIRWMAGLVTYGNNSKFRNDFRTELLKLPLDIWPYGWDQDILNSLDSVYHYKKLNVGEWMSFGRGGGTFFTLKGDQKILEGYLDVYHNILKNVQQ